MNKTIDIKSLQKKVRRNKSAENNTTAEKTFMQKAEELMTRDIRLFGKAFSDKIKESFYLELSSLMEAGLDIRTALQLLRDEQTKKTPKAILNEVLEKVVNGSSFSAALKENKNFTPYEYYTIEIGEETGKLIAVLKQLSVYYKSKIKQRRQIISALTYPAIVLSVAMASILFMMNFVVPIPIRGQQVQSLRDAYLSAHRLPRFQHSSITAPAAQPSFLYWF